MKLSVALAAACALGALAAVTDAAPTAAPTQVAGFSYVKSLAGIDEYRLDSNGLDVLLVPDHSAPVVTFIVTYHVGSRNEVIGTTGATHLLEHLMFKGSERYNDAKGNSVKQYLESIGGEYNANTWLDRTAYFAEVGSENLEGYMAIEADRMRNLWLRESDRRPEMTVVRNEFEIGENDPRGGARQGDLRNRLSGASLSPFDDWLAQRHRKGADREVARLLRHVLLAGQCNGVRHR